MQLIDRLKSGWTPLKFLRVGLGGLILYSSFEPVQVTGIVVGVVFTGISLFTDGVCCAGAACSSPVKKEAPATIENTEYEELGTGQ